MAQFTSFFIIFSMAIVTTYSIFCSAYCKPNQCSGTAKNQCTGCDSPFLLSGGSCVIDTSTGYSVPFQSNNMTASPTGSASCGAYTFTGTLQSGQNFTVTTSTAITAPHIKVRLILWIILYEDWNTATDYIQARINTTGVAQRFNISNRQTTEQLCGPSGLQSYIKYDFQFAHTDIISPLSFQVYTYQSGGSQKWGIKQQMLLMINCHIYCLTCTDVLSTTCTSCNTGYKLSGTTCAASCLAGYGSTTNATLCVLCDLKCVICYQTSTNCSSCTTSAPNEAFLYGYQCLTTCPTGYNKNYTTHVCDPCSNSACLSCNVSNYAQCYSCNSTTFWLSYDCIYSCPGGTFPVMPNCTACDISCAICTNKPTPCTVCNTGYKLSGTTCATSCLTGYGSTTNTSLCVLCDVKCAVCYQTSTNCSSCTTTAPNEAFLYGTQCLTTCPTGYFGDVLTHTCLMCTNAYCLSCNPTNLSQCYSCNTSSFWLSYDCITTCPGGTFPAMPNCTTCDVSCAICTNKPTPCTVCNTGYKLSGTTCATSCLTGYGSTTNTSLCVLCDLKCAVCYQISTNCSSCTTTAPNEAFLYGTQCLTTCPTGYFGDVLTHTCLMCTNAYCLSCNPTNLSQCYSCNSSSFWLSYDCITTCPAGTFPASPNCTTCDISCAICTNKPTPCTVCNTGYKLSGTTCATSCLTGYGSTTNTSLCVLCDVKCAVCYQTSTNCSSCTTTAPNEAFLYGTQCLTTCPTGYFGDVLTHTCLMCTNAYCLSCNPTNLSQCYSCNTSSFWLSYDCITTCPAGTFPASPNCTTCDVSCAICTNKPTPCTVCNTGYKLSGTTCATTCLTQYGSTTNTSFCVLCDVKCVVCYQTSTNCSSCTTTAPNEAFLYGTQCLTTCPTGYFADTATHTCLLCINPSCSSCNTTNLSQCYLCNSPKYWYTFDCIGNCPSGTYPNSPNCTVCDVSCAVCTGSPSPCSVCKPTYYFLNNSCLLTCPVNYFQHTPSMTCKNCAIDCVTASISMSFPLQNQLQILISFSRPIDFSTFPYDTFYNLNISDPTITLSQFIITHSIASDRSYKVILTPVSESLLMDQVPFNVEINNFTNSFYSQDGYLFSDTIFQLTDFELWTIKQKIQKWELQDLEDINNWLNSAFTQPWTQEIKKTGVFALLFPGAQLCSTIILHNATPPVNMYEGARFWGTFIYFQVPRWEQNGTSLKRIFSDLIYPKLSTNARRVLAITNDQQIVDWRFQRTGHTGYFIFDAYIPLIIIVCTWIPIIVLEILAKKLKKKAQQIKKMKTIFYSILHRLHQICMFYLLLALCLDWAYFTSHQLTYYKYASLAAGVIFAVYCLIYEIHAFYKIIPYTYTDISSKKFDLFVEKYSFFLRDIRFEQYGLYPRWQCIHFLRPYNYQVLSFFRLALILASLPLFQNIVYGCVSCLIVFQSLEITRFLLTWPYYTPWRNYYKLSLEVTLLLIFVMYLLADIIFRTGFEQQGVSIQWSSSYLGVGWVGFVLLFIYNVMYFVYFIIDVVIGCIYTNRQRMQFPRNTFYRQMLEDYQTCRDIHNPTLKQSEAHTYLSSSMATNKKGYISLLNSLHKAEPALEPNVSKNPKQTIELIAHRGNLCEHDYDKFWKIKVKIEQYQITQAGQNKYSITYEKIKDLYMHLNPDVTKKYNLLMPSKKTRDVKITPLQNEFYFKLVDNIYRNYRTVNSESVIVRTFLKVDQNLFKPGEKIPFKPEQMTQEIQIKNTNGTSEKQKLGKVLKGFPVAEELLSLL